MWLYYSRRVRAVAKCTACTSPYRVFTKPWESSHLFPRSNPWVSSLITLWKCTHIWRLGILNSYRVFLMFLKCWHFKIYKKVITTQLGTCSQNHFTTDQRNLLCLCIFRLSVLDIVYKILFRTYNAAVGDFPPVDVDQVYPDPRYLDISTSPYLSFRCRTTGFQS